MLLFLSFPSSKGLSPFVSVLGGEYFTFMLLQEITFSAETASNNMVLKVSFPLFVKYD